MKKLLGLLLLVLSFGVARADMVYVKNNTGNSPAIVVFQDGRIIAYVDRFKPRSTLAVPVDETGGRPLMVIEDGRKNRRYVFLPRKSRPVVALFGTLNRWAR